METDESIVTSEGDEKREANRLSVVATLGILIATIAATVVASLAALSSFHGGEADTHSTAWATYSNEMLLSDNEHVDAQTDSRDAHVEDAWQAQLLTILAGESSNPLISAALATEASAATLAGVRDVAHTPISGAPNSSSPSPARFCQGFSQLEAKYDCAYEVATAYSSISLNDNLQERAYIACVSMLAIALFLFALSKMLSQPSMSKLFLGLGALITLIAVGWTAAESLLAPAPTPSGSAISAYEKGWQDEQNGDHPTTVEALLGKATSEDPSFVDAWQQLGNEEVLHPVAGQTHRQCSSGLSALRHAWSLRGAPDDLDLLAVGEVVCGEPKLALASLEQASNNSSDVLAGPALALAQLASGQQSRAKTTLDNAVTSMEDQGRGSVFLNFWFQQIFIDIQALGATSVPPARRTAFIGWMEHEQAKAALDEFDLEPPRPSPGVSVTASVTAPPANPGVAYGLVPVALVLQYSGLRKGDVISAIWIQAGTTEGTRLVSTLTLPGTSLFVVGQPGGPTAGKGTFAVPTLDFVTAGNYQIELAVNAVPSGKLISVSVPMSTAKHSFLPLPPPKPKPLPVSTTTTTAPPQQAVSNSATTTTTSTTTTTTTTTPSSTTTTATIPPTPLARSGAPTVPCTP